MGFSPPLRQESLHDYGTKRRWLSDWIFDEDPYGYLRDETTQERQAFDVFPFRSSDDDDEHTMIHLGDVFSQTHRPSLARRYHMVATAASSVLFLYDTLWLPATLTIKDVFLVSRNGNVDFNEIYLSKKPLHDLEGSAITTKHDFSSEKTGVRTPYYLGIFLMEIMLWKPVYEFCNDECIDLSAVAPEVIFDPATTKDFARIKDILERIEFITTPDFRKVLEHCIKCDFNADRLSLDNHIFRQAIYTDTVLPLQ